MRRRGWLRAVGRPAFLLVPLGLLAAPACAPARQSVTGFPLYGAEAGPTGILDASKRIQEDLERVDRAIERTAPATGGPDAGPGAPPPLRTVALRSLLAAHMAIANERMSYADPPQLDVPPYPPVILYPRLTSPAIVEPQVVRMKEGPRLAWVVPLILDKDSLYWDLSPETVWLGMSPRRNLYNDPRGHLSAFLVPHGETDIAKRRPLDLMPYFHELEPLTVRLGDGKDFTLPDVEPTRAGIVGALPVAGPGIQDGVQPGYYDIQLFPRIKAKDLQTPWGRAFGDALARGDWYAALRQIETFPGADRAGGAWGLEQDLLAVAGAIEAFVPTRFDAALDPIRAWILHWAWSLPDPKNARLGAPREVVCAVQRFVLRSHQPSPVLLDEPHPATEPFSFIASGDLQFHEDRAHLFRFLRLIGAYGQESEADRGSFLAPDVRARLRNLKFVLVAGDFGDGAGLSSAPHTAIVAGLGLHPPLSPYDVEFPTVRRELERTRVPVIAVPGNHDGFASYGGLLNTAFDWAGQLLKAPPEPIQFLTHPLGHGLQELGQRMPVLVKVGRLNRHPYFDGLVQWQYEFGPLNTAFTYRGCSFLAFNSYNLPQLYRDQVGPLANNWGGGVDPADALWFDVMTHWQRKRLVADPSGGWTGHQFVFMHHDPRAAVPDPKKTGVEVGAGHYDQSDSPFNTLTFGWFGLGYSPLNPLYVPIVTPISTNVTRLLTTDDRFNQEWMGPAWMSDTHCHHARVLVESMNDNLGGPAAPGGGVSHVFFGHNDDVAEGTWAQADQGNRVFRKDPGQRWTGCPYGKKSALAPFGRLRTVEPFAWGREMRVPEGRNAYVVRMDDLGDNGSDEHGFHLVTVYPNPGGQPVVEVTHVPIPAEAPATAPR